MSAALAGADVFALAHRQQPMNLNAEAALLGAMLANNVKALELVEEFLRGHHFADPLHGRVYDLIVAGVAAQRVVSGINLVSLLGAEPLVGLDGKVMPPAAFAGYLVGSMVSILHAREYGRTVYDCWLRRELIKAGADMVEAAFMPPAGGGAAVMEAHESALLEIAKGAGEVSPPVSLGQAVREATAMTEAASKRSSPLAGLTTGYAALDRMTAGLLPQQMILLGARPSMGKTALGLGIAVRAAAAGAHVLFWSGEMAAPQLGARIAAAHTGLSTTSVFTGRRWDVPPDAHGQPMMLDTAEWSRLVLAEQAAAQLPLWFDTRSALSVQALRARARRMRRQKKLDLLVVDYVGLLRPVEGAPVMKLYELMTQISAALLALAHELDIPVLAMAQLNRGTESREDKTPQLSDLRDSGALEQDSNIVLFLHRPHYYLSRAGEPVRRESEADDKYFERLGRWETAMKSNAGVAHVSVAKNRNGPTGGTRLHFQDDTSWFRDESEATDGPAWMQQL